MAKIELRFIFTLLIFLVACSKEKVNDEKSKLPSGMKELSILNPNDRDDILVKVIYEGWTLSEDKDGHPRLYTSRKMKLQNLLKVLGISKSDLVVSGNRKEAVVKSNLFTCRFISEEPFEASNNLEVIAKLHQTLKFKEVREYKFPSIMVEEDYIPIQKGDVYDRDCITTRLLTKDWEGILDSKGELFCLRKQSIKFNSLKNLINFKDSDVDWNGNLGVIQNKYLACFIIKKTNTDNSEKNFVTKTIIFDISKLRNGLDDQTITVKPEWEKLINVVFK